MGDMACGWCGQSLSGGRGRRYCPRPRTCRQAAYRARKRAEAAIPPRVALLQISQALQEHALGLDALLSGLIHQERAVPGVHCAAAVGFRRLVEELIRCAVLADREAGATWAGIGQPLGISADAARARYGKVRLL